MTPPCQTAQLAESHGERDFGQLRGLARASLATDDDDLVGRHGGHDFFAFARYGQGFGEIDGERCHCPDYPR